MTPPKRFRILLVDDDPLIVELLCARLLAKGYLVMTACDGQDAYEATKKDLPDVIICDVVMPKVDGPSFCRRMRAEGSRIPFLFLTAKGQPQDVVDLLSAGADDYLVKPFEAAELIARIAAILRRAPPAEKTI